MRMRNSRFGWQRPETTLRGSIDQTFWSSNSDDFDSNIIGIPFSIRVLNLSGEKIPTSLIYRAAYSRQIRDILPSSLVLNRGNSKVSTNQWELVSCP